jgi:hypothetical protein
MSTRTTSIRPRTGLALALAAVSALGVSACDDADDSETDTTLVDELQSDPDVPFDPDVSDFGDITETDERTNQGFDVDEPGPVGNQVSPNQVTD